MGSRLHRRITMMDILAVLGPFYVFSSKVDKIIEMYAFVYHSIMLTFPCIVDPLTPNFYIVKLGFTRVYMCFSFLL